MNGELFAPPKIDDVRDADKLKELQRELATRKHVYPRWVADGRIGKPVARERILILEAIIRDYEAKGR